MKTSQEANINLANPNTNPLDLACTITDGASAPGYRLRGVGTGELVNNVKTLAPIGTSTGTTDNLGYTFFSFANVATLSTSNSYGYLDYDGVDPIFTTYHPSQTSPRIPDNRRVTAPPSEDPARSYLARCRPATYLA